MPIYLVRLARISDDMCFDEPLPGNVLFVIIVL